MAHNFLCLFQPTYFIKKKENKKRRLNKNACTNMDASSYIVEQLGDEKRKFARAETLKTTTQESKDLVSHAIQEPSTRVPLNWNCVGCSHSLSPFNGNCRAWAGLLLARPSWYRAKHRTDIFSRWAYPFYVLFVFSLYCDRMNMWQSWGDGWRSQARV